jgi:GH15 family glucan-1,4-alpha-glucosidase
VRTGNAAYVQHQLDIYGELVNVIYDASRYGLDTGDTEWRILGQIADFVSKSWKQPDSGIWELRAEPRPFVYSKLMCWVALDRAIRIAGQRNEMHHFQTWVAERDKIRAAILDQGYNPRINSFVESFGSDSVDASALLIPMMEFLPFDDPRIQGTIDAVQKRLTTSAGLVYRYEEPDGLPGNEGAFVLCSFWLVKALASSGRIEEAEDLFERILGFISPLGLFAEEIDPSSGDMLGNFPQAFSHIGLINCALYLGIAKGKSHPGPAPAGKPGKQARENE